MKHIFFVFLFLIAQVASSVSFAGDVMRVGGTYQVSKVYKKNDRHFVVEFSAEKQTGRFDILKLETDHINVAVTNGQSVRLSAEVLSEDGPTAEVAQVLLFLPHRQGRLPVWLLSKNRTQNDLKGAKYLDMHAPVNDYILF